MEQIRPPTDVNASAGVRYDRFISGTSAVMRAIDEMAAEWSIRRIPLLLVGETGTGKRTLATQIHQTCAGEAAVLKSVNCSSLTSELLARVWGSENDNGFGNASGAVTYLLENINDLAPALQSRLLPLIAAAVGSEGKNGTTLISTSARELQQDVHAGAFREDLYYLISGISMTIPPLRYRREDTLPLIDFFLEGYAREFQRPTPSLTASMQRLLLDYPWPGNVAELRDTARMIVAVGDAGLAMAALRSRAQEVQRCGGAHNGISLKQAARAASRQAERELILKVLARTRWNRKRAAQELQISYKAMLYKLKQVGLDMRLSEKEQA